MPARIRPGSSRASFKLPKVPARPAAAPARPAAPAPMGGQPLPVDPGYDASMGSANRNLALSQAALAARRQGLGQTYGLGVNASGVVIDDPSNAYSRAAALKKSYDQAQRGTNTTMAARGQLYSGSYQNQVNENTRQNAQGRDALIRDFLSRNQEITQAELQAQSDWQGATTGAGSDRIQRALENRPDESSVPMSPTVQFVMPSAPAAPRPQAKPKAKPKPKPKRRGKR